VQLPQLPSDGCDYSDDDGDGDDDGDTNGDNGGADAADITANYI
jgi:hypothetical protein